MMKTTNKTLTLLTLICYLAVMSITSVHAFPSFVDTSNISQTEQSSLMTGETPANCHQNTSSESTVSSACQLFCSAMGNVIANEIIIDLKLPQPTADIAFFTRPLPRWKISVEPHPPK